ncbi:voltage-dependent anion channel-domain-containing protein [Chaetomium sp. MPI-SDFR-AT-0129]|nr:voltage-dependent anion channel-domain-containing protein [Chaetomium sp. MPI-SDFR-AT-0129]
MPHSPHGFLPIDPPSGRDTPAYPARPSTESSRADHLDDLKSLPIHTIPSLRLQLWHSIRHDRRVIGDPSDVLPDESPHHNHPEISPHGNTKDDDNTTNNGTHPKLSLRARLRHFTWAWYTLTMSTGGLALLIRAQPHTFPGLHQIGLAIFLLNIFLFLLVTAALITRFCLYRGTFLTSITHPREGFFFPTFFLSLATIITCTQRYGVPSDPESALESTRPLLNAIQAAFWIYVVLSTAVAIGQYSLIFSSTHKFALHTMMPTWILPIFPIMLSGTIAAVIADTQPADAGVRIVSAGWTCQGLGVAVAFMMYAHMVGRLMQSGLPDREHTPGLFMCVGPPAFTALAFIGLAKGLPEEVDHDLDGVGDAAMVETVGVVGAGFLWALSLWWFGIALLAVVRRPPRFFHLGWWAAVFPNTGFTLATISLGTAYRSEGVLWFATGMSLLVLGVYLFVLVHHVRAVVVGEIMLPGRDEDMEEH